MTNFLFFVEGDTDLKFFQDYIKFCFNVSISKDQIRKTDSWNGFVNYAEYFQGNTDNDNGTNFLIIDADTDFNSRKKEIEQLLTKHNIKTELFLTPNNLGNGCLEDLLFDAAKHKQIFDCFDDYSKCVISKKYLPPTKKDKIFAYLDALLEPDYKKGGRNDKIKPLTREYTNIDHWDLNHPSLEPLKIFLSPFFTKI